MSSAKTRMANDVAEPPFWEGDTGTLALNTRRALLSLLRGPYLDAERQPVLWQALLGSVAEVSSRLSDLFLELVLDADLGVAFVRNVAPEGVEVPKAVRTQQLTLVDTLMVLFLRRELLGDASQRTLVSKEDAFDALGPYRVATDLDEAAFRRRLEGSWNKLVDASILVRTDTEDRFEISPVLRLVFGVDECRAVEEAFTTLMASQAEDDGQADDRSGATPGKGLGRAAEGASDDE